MWEISEDHPLPGRKCVRLSGDGTWVSTDCDNAEQDFACSRGKHIHMYKKFQLIHVHMHVNRYRKLNDKTRTLHTIIIYFQILTNAMDRTTAIVMLNARTHLGLTAALVRQDTREQELDRAIAQVCSEH